MQTDHLLGPDAGRLHGTEPSVAVAFGQPPAIRADDKGNVGEDRGRQSERAVKQQLPGRRGNKIVAANNRGNARVGVIDDDGELISRSFLRFPDDEVAADVLAGECSEAAKDVVKSGHVADAESPGKRPADKAGGVGDRTVRTSAGVNDLGSLRMW